jgi:adenine-specific DNA-methyltransferase
MPKSTTATDYQHSQQATQRPDVGVQDQFSRRKPPRTWRYDSSLDPALSWDESRERALAEWLIGLIQRVAAEGEAVVFEQPQTWSGGGVQIASLKAAADALQQLSQPFLNWSGKAERHEVRVPTLPLFVHERHSTKAILEGVRHRRAIGTNRDLFGDGGPTDIGDKLAAYEYQGPWQNRMILGDSLQVMTSLLEFEGLGGQVQMIYVDPPYGVKFGSNFQPFVRRRDVKHGGDDDMTREPEMVKAYRDTWTLGLHSYLTYLRDRLRVARDLLTPSGSVFVQISDENLHHVREVMDEVFGAENFVSVISFVKTSGLNSPDAKLSTLATNNDFLVWYARDSVRLKFQQVYRQKAGPEHGLGTFTWIQQIPGERRPLTPEERKGLAPLPDGRLFARADLTSQKPTTVFDFSFDGTVHNPLPRGWRTTEAGMKRLRDADRLFVAAGSLRYVQFLDDFPVQPHGAFWDDTGTGSFTDDKRYVVQTSTKVIQRCLLMTTDPGDLVLDPTCGSGTTAYVAEQWGRRWITCDTSRVPLALARQRLLTATFPYYELKQPDRGPAGGFVYKRRQNRKGEEVGGLVPHITLKSIANDEPPATEVLVDRPEVVPNVVRVSGPFVVEATIALAQSGGEVDGSPPVEAATASTVAPAAPAPTTAAPAAATVSLDTAVAAADAANGGLDLQIAEARARYGDPAVHIERMTQVLRQSRSLRLPGNRELQLADIRRVHDSDVLHAEAQDAEGRRVAIVFGPEDGAISSDVVFEAAREAYFLKFAALWFFGFAIQAKARELVEDKAKLRLPCAYVTVTPDVAMSDLLKTSRASQIFSVTGLPDALLRTTKLRNADGAALWEVELRGLDLFNPATMETESIDGQATPTWMLDTDYDGMCFYASQVFFPKTGAWDNLQKSLKAEFDPSVWAHLAGTTSEPFALGPRKRVAVKVIDERGNELVRVLEPA